MSKRRSFVVRVWWHDADQCQGQISDPFSQWRRPFHNADELWYWIHHAPDTNTPPAADSDALHKETPS